MDERKKEEMEVPFNKKPSGLWRLALGGGSALYLLFLAGINFLRFQKNYNTHDLFIFENAFWNALHGRIFWNFYEFGNHLGVHFSPGLFLLLPFYALFPKAQTLLFLQSLAICLAGIPLFSLSRKILEDEASSFVVVLAYWCYAPTLGAGFSGFHETPFVIFFLFCLFWAWESRRMRLFWTFVILCLIWKETFSLMFLFLGISFSLRRQTRRAGLPLILLSLAWFIWCFYIIMPLLRGSQVSSSMIQYRFPREIGHSFQEMIINFFRNPGFFIRYAFQKEKALYLLQLVIPLLCLPLLKPLLLIPILPQLTENLLSRRLLGASLLKHYTTPVIPFLFYAAIKAILPIQAFMVKRGIREKRAIRIITLSMLFVCICMIFPSEVYVHILKGERTKDEALHCLSSEELRTAREMGEQAPAEASLAVSGHLAKYFARRKVICYISPGFLRIFPFDYLLYYAPSPDKDIFRIYPDLPELLEKNYELADKKGRLYLYKRRPIAYSAEEQKMMNSIPE